MSRDGIVRIYVDAGRVKEGRAGIVVERGGEVVGYVNHLKLMAGDFNIVQDGEVESGPCVWVEYPTSAVVSASGFEKVEETT
jgi:translation initiation factor IF-2